MRNLQLSFYGKYFENIYLFFHCTQCAAQNYGNGGILKPCESDSAVLWFFHGKISWILIPLAYFYQI